MIYKYINKIKNYFPPDKNWKYQKQTEPPTFGWAKCVGQVELDRQVQKRRDKCSEILNESNNNFVKGKVSLIVLSCKRWWTMERLMESLKSFDDVEKYSNIEKILVDNGSGTEFLNKVRSYIFFDKIVSHKENLGMIGALRDIYAKVDGEYILYFEDDFVFDFNDSFIEKCIRLFSEFPEIGIIRLKNQNNWWKPERRISPLRKISDGTEFWTWLPSSDLMLNGWSAGSVMFRRVAYLSTGELPDLKHIKRSNKMNHAYVYEYIYGKEFNKQWLAAKIKDICPFVQPNDNEQSPGWQ